MRRTKKQILGFLGLGAVVATTAFAASLPTPGATAIETKITDTIQVQVYEPWSVDISTEMPAQITKPDYTFSVAYGDVKNIVVTVTNRNANGAIVNQTEIWRADYTLEELGTGTKDFSLNLDNFDGYGMYTITAIGYNKDNVPIERSLVFTYAKPTAQIDADTGDGYLVIEATPPSEEVYSGVAHVYDASGNEVKTVNITDVNNPQIDLSDLPNGDYTIIVDLQNKAGEQIGTETYTSTNTVFRPTLPETTKATTDIRAVIRNSDGDILGIYTANIATGTVTVMDANGNIIDTIANGYRDGKFYIPTPNGMIDGEYSVEITYLDGTRIVGIPYILEFTYEEGEIIPVPDTGSFFQNLNISKEDYLITGLIVFFALAIVGFGIVSRSSKTRKPAKRSRK